MIIEQKIIFKNTNEDACLKLFIDYHGLKLLWSWMVDIDRLNDISYINLKLKIINVLHKIPIKNRTIVEECKLLSTVQRWSDNNQNKLNTSFLFNSSTGKILLLNSSCLL
jgi:histone-lysine N-methyltransferase SETD2